MTGDESPPCASEEVDARLLRRLALGVPAGDGCGDDVVLPRAAAGEEEAELLSEWARFIVYCCCYVEWAKEKETRAMRLGVVGKEAWNCWF